MKTLLFTFLLLSSCTTFDRRAELVWQLENAIDVGQTLTIADHPECYKESGDWAPFIGAHPSRSQVVSIGAAWGTGHYLISKWLDDHAPLWLARSWKLFTVTSNGINISNNHALNFQGCPRL